MSAEDKAIPNAILGKAAGIAIFPNTVKAGFVFGGVRGRGLLSARGPSGWSSPAFLTLTGGSFGLQIGGQATDVILIINDNAAGNLVSNQFRSDASSPPVPSAATRRPNRSALRVDPVTEGGPSFAGVDQGSTIRRISTPISGSTANPRQSRSCSTARPARRSQSARGARHSTGTPGNRRSAIQSRRTYVEFSGAKTRIDVAPRSIGADAACGSVAGGRPGLSSAPGVRRSGLCGSPLRSSCAAGLLAHPPHRR